jgi:hypothetical protein
MKRHERSAPVSKASLELEVLISKFQEDNDLTDIELLQALNSYQQTMLKYMLRYERHGNYDTPAEYASE